MKKVRRSEMAHVPINHSKDPIRLFKSNFLEFFTHIHPAVIVAVWLPIAIYFLIRSIIASSDKSAMVIPAGFVLGVLIWTFAEYTLHRFLFHYKAKSTRAERIFFLFHGVHHAQPQIKTRLVMPLPVSIPLALISYGLFWLVFAGLFQAASLLFPSFSGFMIGYLVYDLTHYATHHFQMRRGYWKYLKRHHMAHHFKTPDARYGVSSPIWDYIFGTMPSK